MRPGRDNLSFGFEPTRPRGSITPASIPGSSRETAVSVSELNDATKTIVEKSFGHFWVRGEVSGFKSIRGHWYFCLRDASAQMQCVVWSSDQWAIPATPDEGMQVTAFAQMTLYPLKGTLQLRVSRMEASGDGLWRKAMEQTISRLTREGLLATERKRPLPRYPRCVAVVTSMKGAALGDIVSVVQRRRPGMRLVVSPAVVQGDGAPASICAAIERVVRWKRADVLIVGRGGGSREDLWAFNDERVARAIAACTIPVISAVGHEIDMTVCDLVADARAATPSVAAETAVPALEDLRATLERHRHRLTRAVERRRDSAGLDLKTVARDMRGASLRAVERRRSELTRAAAHLNALSPLATLARGYAVARSEDGGTLSSVAQFAAGETFHLMLQDGSIKARVEPDSTEVR